MISLTDKIYVQLKPDQSARSFLVSIQKTLRHSPQLIPSDEFHVTIIHVGLVSKLLRSVQPYTYLSADRILKSLDSLVLELRSLLDSLPDTFILTPTKFALFGENSSTCVLRYEMTPALHRIHQESLALLRDFLHEVGIADIDAFMAHDYNLKYALALEPHTALARSSGVTQFQPPSNPMTFSLMPVLYRV